MDFAKNMLMKKFKFSLRKSAATYSNVHWHSTKQYAADLMINFPLAGEMYMLLLLLYPGNMNQQLMRQ